MKWPNPIILKNGDGIFPLRGAEGASRGNRNSLWIMKGTIKFPHERLSRNSKEKFPHERQSREWGNFFLLWLLSLEWGNSIVPWMMNREFFPSPFFKMMGLTFLFTFWKLLKSVSKSVYQKIKIFLPLFNNLIYVIFISYIKAK